MNTKLIMSATAILFAVIGLSLTFAPDNVMHALGIDSSIPVRLLFQLLGAAYYAFAMLNWMAKGALIGGIYNRPIAVANVAHFLVGGLALTKAAFSHDQLPLIISVLAGFYMVAALVFYKVMSTHPLPKTA
jgi:hypothetical protein